MLEVRKMQHHVFHCAVATTPIYNQGLVHDHNCWARELMQGLQLANPDTDWETHMIELKPTEYPRGIARLAKQSFDASIQVFDMDPTDPECLTPQT
jgi:hypothetical protein